jgi:mannosyltransferase OCH1-like enzyme
MNTIHIPQQIFQTHKSVSYLLSKPNLAKAVASWRKYSPEFRYYFFTDAMCDAFMREHFSGDIYDAYQRLPMAVMKADLWRYCIVYKYGGIYADVDTVCEQYPALLIKDGVQLCLAPEPSCPYFCQWVFAAPPGSPILKAVIDLSVKRILGITEFKGEHLVHFLTGPAVFTDAIDQYLVSLGLKVYKNKHISKNNGVIAVYNPKNFHKYVVRHLYAGSETDGWKEQKKLILE